MKLRDEDIAARLQSFSGWSRRSDAIEREFVFPSFADAVAFVVRLAFEAEAADHHPDLRVSYRKVTVSWTTHSEGGVTEKDFAGVGQAERVAAAFLRP
jgi:4a-hydroxytetrahydrobiopterin dehydratase